MEKSVQIAPQSGPPNGDATLNGVATDRTRESRENAIEKSPFGYWLHFQLNVIPYFPQPLWRSAQ